MKNHFTKKYLEAFSFSQFSPLKDSNQFLYLHEQEGTKTLKLFDRNEHASLEDGKVLSSIDFNKQGFRLINKVDEKIYIISDKENKENYNIFSIDLNTKEIKQHTYNEYTSCLRIDDEAVAYYSSRKKSDDGLFLNSVHIHDLKTNDDQHIVDDDGDEYRLGWGQITPSLGGKFLLANVDKENARTNNNYVLIDIERGTKKVLIPKDYESSRLYLLENKVDIQAGFYFVSDCTGFDNLYYFKFSDSTVTKCTDIDFLTSGFRFIEVDGKRHFCVTKILSSESKTFILTFREESAGKVCQLEQELEFTGRVFVYSNEMDFIWACESNLSRSPSMILYRLKDSQWQREFEIPFIKKSAESIVQSTYEYVSYPSFDGLEIPAYVVIPKGEIKGAIITAFYGGSNDFNPMYQIFAEQGFINLSPAVRGSWGHGKEWENMIKGDLGGGEILDLVWGARYLEKKFNLRPEQIGLEGGSHGGYATLRGLTLPDNFKGQDSKYPFGFGICWAGFADIIDFYKTSNIPDWIVNMLGPYEENKELYADRSPINHFEELKAPLFITHGTKDSRVPGSTMESFLEKLKKSDIPHYIYLMDGQGHTGGSVDERIDEFKKMFNFLEESTGLGWRA